MRSPKIAILCNELMRVVGNASVTPPEEHESLRKQIMAAHNAICDEVAARDDAAEEVILAACDYMELLQNPLHCPAYQRQRYEAMQKVKATSQGWIKVVSQ